MVNAPVGQRLGSMIGAIGGVAFVLMNAGALGSPLGSVSRVVGVVVFAFAFWYAVIRTRNHPTRPRPPAEALRVYWICVVAEVVAIPLGNQVLVRVFDRPDLTPVWVVFVVGAHFLPFARAFRVPLFTGLGVALIVVALIGGLATVTISPLGAPLAGVVAGFVLLAFAVLGAYRQQSVTTPVSPGRTGPATGEVNADG